MELAWRADCLRPPVYPNAGLPESASARQATTRQPDDTGSVAVAEFAEAGFVNLPSAAAAAPPRITSPAIRRSLSGARAPDRRDSPGPRDSRPCWSQDWSLSRIFPRRELELRHGRRALRTSPDRRRFKPSWWSRKATFDDRPRRRARQQVAERSQRHRREFRRGHARRRRAGHAPRSSTYIASEPDIARVPIIDRLLQVGGHRGRPANVRPGQVQSSTRSRSRRARPKFKEKARPGRDALRRGSAIVMAFDEDRPGRHELERQGARSAERAFKHPHRGGRLCAPQDVIFDLEHPHRRHRHGGAQRGTR